MADIRPNSEIADGVHWIKGYSNCYIVEEGEDLILIDTEMNGKAEPILRYIHDELEDRRVVKVFLTHHHVDHVKGAPKIEEVYHPLFYAHKGDAAFILGEAKRPLPRNVLLKPLFFILDPFIRARPIESVELIEDGQVVDGIQSIFLPGHTMGSMGFAKNGVMFSGDAVVTDRKGNPSLPLGLFTENMEMARHSFKKLSTYDFDVLVCGHGPPILEDASIQVKEAVDRLNL
ncbi:MAG: MBL fold metallo-hydrolase [Methanobacteriota archaeon]|nr:MAG: MBL fold metallo-hydrolase [Euryarchaeota archaeon]